MLVIGLVKTWNEWMSSFPISSVSQYDRSQELINLMTLINWQASYSVGIKVIDEQHQHLIEIINALAEKIESTVGEIDLRDFFQEIKNYGDYHFQTEETYFGQYEYPERAAHLAAHKSYRKIVEDFLSHPGDNHMVAEDLLGFLQKWWVEHITGMDQTLRGLAQSQP